MSGMHAFAGRLEFVMLETAHVMRAVEGTPCEHNQLASVLRLSGA
jgi:hypothetical protein